MPISQKISSDALDKKVKEIMRFAPQGVEAVLKNESKLLVEELVDRTKPRSLGKLKQKVDRTYRRVFESDASGKTGISGAAMAELYKAQHDPHYRAKPRIAILGAALLEAIQKAKSHAGHFAAGWLGKGNPTGARRGVPAYVKARHIEGQISLHRPGDSLIVKGENKVSFMKHFPKIREAERRLLVAAMKTRAYKIGKNLELIAKGVKNYRIPKQ
jgi:hypothetical protein